MAMEQFLLDVEVYAAKAGVKPSTIVQRAAGVSGAAWRRWSEKRGSPTLETVDRIRAYIADNPVSPDEATDAGAAA